MDKHDIKLLARCYQDCHLIGVFVFLFWGFKRDSVTTLLTQQKLCGKGDHGIFYKVILLLKDGFTAKDLILDAICCLIFCMSVVKV